MKSMEILHSIVETEQKARGAYEDALRRQDSYDDYIEAQKQALREKAYAEADAKLEALEKAERERADRDILRQEARQGQEFARANLFYQQNRSSFVDRMFELVVESDV